MTTALADHVTATDTDSGMVLLDLRSGRYWQLNGTAAAVVRGLSNGDRVESVVDGLSQRHPAQAGRVAADVDSFVRSLRAAGLVTG